MARQQRQHRTPTAVSLASVCHRVFIVFFIAASPLMRGRSVATRNVATVNINIAAHVDIVNMTPYHPNDGQKTRQSIPSWRPVAGAAAGGASHDREGRRRGAHACAPSATKLGVSRTALYRHFADKSALLAAVATEGFRTLRLQTQDAWETHGGGRKGFEAMGEAYVRFAVAHPSHYRVMFGGYVRDACAGFGSGEGRRGCLSGARRRASISQQKQGLVRRDNPLALAQYIWATVHGIAMLAIDGQLKQPTDDVIRFANERHANWYRVHNPESGPKSRVQSRRVQSPKSWSPESGVRSLETRTGLDPWVHAELPDAPAPQGFSG